MQHFRFFKYFGLIIILFLIGCTNTNVSDQKVAKIFLIDLYRPEKLFIKEYLKETGCDDHLVGIETQINFSEDSLQSTLEELFAIKNDTPDGLYNSLQSSDLKVDQINSDGDTIEVYLSGPYSLAGDCDDLRFVDQIQATVLQFTAKASIFINDAPLEDFLGP